MQLLVIESEREFTNWLVEKLAVSGFAALRADSPQQVLRDGLAARAVAVLIDVGMAGPRGSTLVRPLRDAGIDQPLLILSTRGDWRDRVEALDAGADDYLVKPVRAEEVAARLRAIIRRAAGSARDRIGHGDVEIDLKMRSAWLAGVPLVLTRNEFRLLRLFLLRSDCVISNQQMSNLLYPDGAKRSFNAVEVNIARLRRKIGHDRIRTIRGVGYRFISAPHGSPGSGTDQWESRQEQTPACVN